MHGEPRRVFWSVDVTERLISSLDPAHDGFRDVLDVDRRQEFPNRMQVSVQRLPHPPLQRGRIDGVQRLDVPLPPRDDGLLSADPVDQVCNGFNTQERHITGDHEGVGASDQTETGVDARQRRRLAGFLRALPITLDTETADQAWTATIRLAERHRLSVYDAAYLELAQRCKLPLQRRVRFVCLLDLDQANLMR